jgi:hypothetical protein
MRYFDIGIPFEVRFPVQQREPLSGPTDRYSAGNGCIMRLAAVPMFSTLIGKVIRMSEKARALRTEPQSVFRQAGCSAQSCFRH